MPIGENFKEDLKNHGVRESAEKSIEDKDVPAVKKVLSETVPEMPDDISLMESWDLGKYLGLYLSAASWATNCIAELEIDLATADRLLDYVYHKKLEGLTGSIADRNREIKRDSKYFEYQTEREKIKAAIDLLKSRQSALKEYGKSISREITIRHDDSSNNIEGRGDSSPRRERPKPPGKSIYKQTDSGVPQ